MKELIKDKIEELLSEEYACSRAELNGKQTVYSVHPEEGQRILKLLAYRNCVVICTSKDLHKKVRELLQGKSRDEMFEVPLYSASVTNIGSRMVANRCGYIPYWVDTFGTILDGSSAYQPMAQGLLAEFMA